MNVNLSVCIMHVPDDPNRRAWVRDMTRVLARGQLVPTICRDVDRKGVWPTAKSAWLRYHPNCTHHMVLQDDVQLCTHFVKLVTTAIEHKPDEILCLYSPSQHLKARGTAWWRTRGGTWGQALILPRRRIHEFLNWSAAHVDEEYTYDDTRMALWSIERGIDVWVTIPSLVQHLGMNNSLLGHAGTIGNNARVSLNYNRDIESVDWSVEQPALPTKVPPLKSIYKHYHPNGIVTATGV